MLLPVNHIFFDQANTMITDTPDSPPIFHSIPSPSHSLTFVTMYFEEKYQLGYDLESSMKQ
jgi:hypothetical protein